MAETGGELCRVTVVAPRMQLNVAVPHEGPLAHLLPTLLWHSGEQLAEQGVPPGAWGLKRVGEGRFDLGRPMAALGIRDGDILYLRTREGAAPAPLFDDTADAITTTLRERARRWSQGDTRVAALSAIGVLLTAGAFTLAAAGGALARLTGHAAAVSASAALVIALTAACVAGAALLGAAAVSRAFGDASLATVVALGALPYALVAGLLVLPSLNASAGGAVKAVT